MITPSLKSYVHTPEQTGFVVLRSNAGRWLCSVRVWWVICIVCAALQTWADRYVMGPDGISYLDMASQALKSGSQHFVNAHWSPAYPALISLSLMIFRPSPRYEFQVVHALNFIIFLIVLASFTFFFKSWLAARRAHSSASIKEESQFVPFAFGIFLWFMLEFVSLGLVTPDLCVTAMVFLIAGTSCRISVMGSNWKYYLILGGLLGGGYYVKTALLPLSVVVLALLFLWPPFGKRNRIRVLAAAAVFIAVVSPLVVLMSRHVGHTSLGEVGRMDYEWFVQGVWDEQTGWTGAIQYAHGGLQHPPRVLLEKPAVFNFPRFTAATDAYHYEPPYWFAGEKLHFPVRGFLTELKHALNAYAEMCIAFAALFGGLLAGALLAVHAGWIPRPDRTCLWTLLWPTAACLMYALVFVDRRYVGVFFVLIWLGLYGLFWPGLSSSLRIAIVAMVLGALFISCTEHLLLDLVYQGRPAFILNGERLRTAGVDRGSRFATVGRLHDPACVRYLQGHIVAEVDHPDEFWSLRAEDLAKVKKQLVGIGIRAILAEDRPHRSTPDEWQDLMPDSTGARLSVLVLDNIQGSASIQR